MVWFIDGHEQGLSGMMVALLLCAYTQGVYASRRIARACEERLDVMAATGMQRPDVRTISEFRRRHLEALSALFVQVLGLCRAAGLVQLGHVALVAAEWALVCIAHNLTKLRAARAAPIA